MVGVAPHFEFLSLRMMLFLVLTFFFVFSMCDLYNDIASMWNDHYSQLFNCVKGDTHKSDVLDVISLVSGDCDMFNQNDFNLP